VSPHDLLGQIHQGLLGHRLVRDAETLRVQASAAARKKSGVFYTPPYVAQYMVRTSLGPLLRERRVVGRHADPLRILDPACGCGAFLTEALGQLVPGGPPEGSGDGPLPWASLYGVDLDPEAVLTCRRALWLRHAQRVSPEAATAAAEPLARNVGCGDVLLGQPLGERDAGFDLVLGNPPYRRELYTKDLLNAVSQTELGQRCRAPRMDYWYYFLHRGLELLRPGGRLVFIVGAYWTAGTGAQKLIRELRQSAQIEELALLENAPVFDGVAGRHLILTVCKAAATRPTRVKRPAAGGVPDAEALLGGSGDWEVFDKTPEQLFRAGRIDLEPPADALLAQFAQGTPLGKLGQVRQGIAENPAAVNRRTNERFGCPWTVGEGVFALTRPELARLALSEEERELIRPYYDLCDLGRYDLAERPSRGLIYATHKTWPSLEQHPGLAAHLARFRPIMEQRRETRRGLRGWWQLHWPREESLWRADKILSVQMGARPAFVPARGAVYVPFSVNVFVPAAGVREHLSYVTAVLNSRLLWKWYQHYAKRRGIGLEINAGVLAQSPIRRIDFGRDEEVRCHDQIVALVAELLDRNRALRKGDDGAGAGSLPRCLRPLEEALDQAIYRLYGLSASEIALVERETRGDRSASGFRAQ
jgi:adenine-specific DNA-methyltransferase